MISTRSLNPIYGFDLGEVGPNCYRSDDIVVPMLSSIFNFALPRTLPTASRGMAWALQECSSRCSMQRFEFGISSAILQE